MYNGLYKYIYNRLNVHGVNASLYIPILTNACTPLSSKKDKVA